MRKKLYKYSYALGYNTRDNPTAVKFNSGQVLENVLPNDPNCIPRNGSGKFGNPMGAFNGAGTVLHTFAYSTTLGDRLICISQNGSETSIYTKLKDTGSVDQLIVTSLELNFTSLQVSWLRILGDVYLSNGVDRVYILEVQIDGTFVFRNANIERPDDSQDDNIGVVPGPGGSMTPDKFIAYAVTYVRRTDNDGNGNGGLDDNGDPQRQIFDNNLDVYNPGRLESAEIIFDKDNPNLTGERRSVFVSGTFLQVQILLSNLLNLDPQVTHARIYRSLEFDTSVEALGASLRWTGDFPVSGPASEVDPNGQLFYVDNASDATMAGNFNFSLNIGFDPMPAGTTMVFHKGRLWLGGVTDGGQELRGRYYYSIPFLDPDFPQKWFSMFLRGTNSFEIGGESTGTATTITGWKDTDHEDDEFVSIVDVSRNDIIFINTKSVWFLPDGDPETFEPELIDRENGTVFSRSVVHIGDAIYYLSNNGPVMIEGRFVKFINEHTAGECWPEIYDGSIGYFFSVAEPLLVKGYYTRENWILADNDQVICIYMPYKQTGFGPWTFVPAALTPIKFGIGSVFNDKELVVYPYNSPNTQFYHVLDPSLQNDDGNDFTMRAKGKAQYMSEKDREMFGEAAGLLMFVEFTDLGDFLLILHSDYSRNVSVWTYEQRDESFILQAPLSGNKFRLNIFQPIPEGFMGQHFEIEWVKTHKTPYRFINKGWSLETIIRRKTTEYVSVDFVQTKIGNIIETGTAPHDIIESGVAAIEITEGNS